MEDWQQQQQQTQAPKEAAPVPPPPAPPEVPPPVPPEVPPPAQSETANPAPIAPAPPVAVPAAPAWRPAPENPVDPVAERRVPPPFVVPEDEPHAFDHGHGPPVVLVLRRAIAFLIDTAGLGFVFLTFLYRLVAAGTIPFAQDDRGFLQLAAFALFSALSFLFVSELVTGTSLGKLLMGLHVRNVDGTKTHGHQHLVRTLLRALDVLLVGLVLVLFSRHRQRAGDLASGTTVGRSPLGVFAPVTALIVLGFIGYYSFTGGGKDAAAAVWTKVKALAPAVEHTLAMYVRMPAIGTLPNAQPSGAATNVPAPQPTQAATGKP